MAEANKSEKEEPLFDNNDCININGLIRLGLRDAVVQAFNKVLTNNNADERVNLVGKESMGFDMAVMDAVSEALNAKTADGIAIDDHLVAAAVKAANKWIDDRAPKK
jgi:flavoprotein